MMDESFGTGRNDRAAIFKIVYHSNIVVQDGTDRIIANVRDILAWSRSWNAKNGITGALVLSDNNFAQILEGPSHAVKSLFGHISCDRRHKNIQLLMHDFFPERDFGAWAMAYAAAERGPMVNLASDPRSVRAGMPTSAERMLHFLRQSVMRDRVPVPE